MPRHLLFEDVRPRTVASVWVASALLLVGALWGSAAFGDWARPPSDFVSVCGDSVPAIPPPSAGLAPRIAALDSMMACTERMEVQYIARGDRASSASLVLYGLAGIAVCFSAVVTRRFVRARRGELGRGDA